jgi:hypothetical protein
MRFAKNVAMPMAAPYGVMVEYSFGASATSICAPSSGESVSGRWGFLRRIPFDPTWTVCTFGWPVELAVVAVGRAPGTSVPATTVMTVGAVVPVARKLVVIATSGQDAYAGRVHW